MEDLNFMIKLQQKEVEQRQDLDIANSFYKIKRCNTISSSI